MEMTARELRETVEMAFNRSHSHFSLSLFTLTFHSHFQLSLSTLAFHSHFSFSLFNSHFLTFTFSLSLFTYFTPFLHLEFGGKILKGQNQLKLISRQIGHKPGRRPHERGVCGKLPSGGFSSSSSLTVCFVDSRQCSLAVQASIDWKCCTTYHLTISSERGNTIYGKRKKH